MLRITTTEKEHDQKWILQGRLAGPWVSELRSTWHSAEAQVGPTFYPRFTVASLPAVFLVVLFAMIVLFPATASASDQSAVVLERYSAGLAEKGVQDRLPVLVEVEASVPRLDKHAHAEAIRRWTGGRRKYQFLLVEGDSLVRGEMIARYFAIDTEAVPFTEANYKFRFIATKEDAYVFRITPRKKRPGMIAGELWIDSATGRVLHVEGRLVKTPSVLLRRIDIWQETDAVSTRITQVHFDTRFMGRAELTIRERSYTGGDRSIAAAEVVNVTP